MLELVVWVLALAPVGLALLELSAEDFSIRMYWYWCLY
jgi:hypothetical protein